MASNREKTVLSLLFVGSAFTLFGIILVHNGQDLAGSAYFDDMVSLVQPSLKLHRGSQRSQEAILLHPRSSKGNVTEHSQSLKQENNSTKAVEGKHPRNASVAITPNSSLNQMREDNHIQIEQKDVSALLPGEVAGVPTSPKSYVSSKMHPFSTGNWFKVAVQILFGIVYYYMIVAKYPPLRPGQSATLAAIKIQGMNEFESLKEVTLPNMLLSFLCSGPRAAHTFHSTGTMTYCIGLFAMTLFPCCTLCVTNAVTDLNERLGGQKRDLLMSCVCAWCCSCCVIAQDAQALDFITGAKTGFCDVEVV